jgi:hypothetical protein
MLEPATLRKPFVALFMALLFSAGWTYYHLGLFIPKALEARAARGLGNGYAFGDDFYPIWVTAREWRIAHRDPYSDETTRGIQTGLFGRPLNARDPLDLPSDYRVFSYPAFADLLFWPTVTLDFPRLRVVLAIVLPLLTVCSLWLWMLALDWRVHGAWFAVIALLAVCNYPVLEAIFAGQPGLIVGFLLASSALALRRNRLLLAGMLLALTLIKPQMTTLAIIYLLLWSFAEWSQRWRLTAGFLGTKLLLVGTSVLIWPHWIGEWLRIIFGYHRYATPPLASALLGPPLGAHAGPFVIVAIVVAALVLAWRNRWARADSSQFWLTFSLLLAITSVTFLPGQAVYDHVILFPGIFLLIQHWRKLRAAGRAFRAMQNIGAAVLFWPWFAAVALIVSRPWIAPERFYSPAVFALPIRTAASLPFVVLALLAYASRVIGTALREPA